MESISLQFSDPLISKEGLSKKLKLKVKSIIWINKRKSKAVVCVKQKK